MCGWCNRILKVDLSRQTFHEEELDSTQKKLFLGGRGLGAKWVYDRGQVEPLSADNLLVFAAGPLTGTGTLASGRATAVSKSPLTGLICYSNVGGTFGVQLKKAGYDAIIIDGEAPEPVLLEITDSGPVLKSARDLWGKNTGEVFGSLKKYKAVLCIGIAGEKKVRLASIVHNRSHVFGRGGLGAVMGAKGLKAIVLSSENDNAGIAHPEEFKKRQENLRKILKASPVLKNFSLLGTPSLVKVIDWAGLLPVRNFRTRDFPYIDEVSGERLKALYLPKSKACAACPIACKKETREKVPLPEFETIGMLGPNNGNALLPSILEMNAMCNDYGLDTISAGAVLACHAEVTGRELNPEEMSGLIAKIGNAEGIGAELGEGSLRYSQRHGKGQASISVKGLELPAYDPRGAYGLALAYGTSNRGGCHVGAYMIAPEVLRKPKAIPPRTFRGKPSYVAVFQDTFAAVDSLIICKFAYLAAGQEEYANILSPVSGENYTAEDLTKIGERIWNLERLSNVREGYQTRDDYLPDRFYNEKAVGNDQSLEPIVRSDYEEALAEYYRHRGWDKQGVPGEAKLRELGLGV